MVPNHHSLAVIGGHSRLLLGMFALCRRESMVRWCRFTGFLNSRILGFLSSFLLRHHFIRRG